MELKKVKAGRLYRVRGAVDPRGAHDSVAECVDNGLKSGRPIRIPKAAKFKTKRDWFYVQPRNIIAPVEVPDAS